MKNIELHFLREHVDFFPSDYTQPPFQRIHNQHRLCSSRNEQTDFLSLSLIVFFLFHLFLPQHIQMLMRNASDVRGLAFPRLLTCDEGFICANRSQSQSTRGINSNWSARSRRKSQPPPAAIWQAALGMGAWVAHFEPQKWLCKPAKSLHMAYPLAKSNALSSSFTLFTL